MPYDEHFAEILVDDISKETTLDKTILEQAK